ncbi:MAG: HAMP domain-containing histidine kinase, partial [Alphaproteobacteria bacterium]|nr:HAMP domain-containing histidine kinase [Alphaproteobacteria bacterium]
GVRRMVGTHTDITEQKEKEEQLKHLNADLESFAYIASHDLRAPLVNLRGFAGELELALKEALPLVDKAAAALKPKEQETIQTAFQKDIPESLGFIHTAVDKMDMLTTAILDLSRIGRREYRDELVDTTAVVKRCLDTLAYEIQTKKIQVTCEDLPPLLIDPLALEQIFSNILDNAVKYLDPSRPGMIRIQAKQLPGAVEFSIEDNGKGIAIVDRHKVFDIFRRAGNSSNVRGIGIGMAFVKTTLRRLGGKIWFESAPGMGATFCFTIPQHSHN